MSPSVPNRCSGCGFSLMEVMVAIGVLSIGLLSAAVLAARMMSGSTQSKYMSLAAMLASEKLEDLNRWNSDNPQLCVPTGGPSVGSLTEDVLQTTSCISGSSGTVNYYDDVNLGLSSGADCPGSSAGCFSETMSSISGGNTVYTTTYHSPDGTITTSAASPVAPASSTFHRRWVIESSPTINGSVVTGVRRVTVLVTLSDQSVKPTVTFQMSMVRP